MLTLSWSLLVAIHPKGKCSVSVFPRGVYDVGSFSRSRGLRQQESSRGLRQSATPFLEPVGVGLNTHHCCPLFVHWHCQHEVASCRRVCGGRSAHYLPCPVLWIVQQVSLLFPVISWVCCCPAQGVILGGFSLPANCSLACLSAQVKGGVS